DPTELQTSAAKQVSGCFSIFLLKPARRRVLTHVSQSASALVLLEQELAEIFRAPKNLCSGFRPGLDRGTERDGFTQSGASMEAAALGCGNGNVQNLRCFLDGQVLKLGQFDDRAYTRAESTYGAVKNGAALALHIGLLRIWGTIRDLKMQSRFAGRGQLVRGNLARATILAINHEGRIHD